MIITCPACAKRYLVDDNAISTKGREVQCIGCENKWFFSPPPENGSFHQVHLDLIGLKSSTQDNKTPLRWAWVLTPAVVLVLLLTTYINRMVIVQTYPPAGVLLQAMGVPVNQVPQGLNIQSIESYDEKGKITIRGKIHNTSNRMQVVPAVQIRLYGSCAKAPWYDRLIKSINAGEKDSCVLKKWSYTLPTTRIFPGETLSFETTSTSLAHKAHSVSVKF